MSMAATTMDLAPMLCVLFLGARMRALQMDPKHGNPQRWAQNCFFLCTYSIIVQTCVAIFVPLILGGEVKQGRAAGDVVVDKVDALGGYLAKGLSVLRFLVMLGVYAGALAVVCAVFTMEHPDGKEHTIPVSPTMQCVVNLAFQYFFIYILLWIFITVEDFTDMDLEFVRDAIETAKSTVQFAPMLCVLFIATRMRALQITDNKGAPQGWAQDGMYMASWSLLVQFLMCLIMPIFTGKTYTTDSLDGSKTADKEPISNPIGAWIVTITRYLALIGLYAGVILVVCGALMMTPETANGRGSVPLLGEMEDATGVDLVPGAPPSVKDLPGAETAMKTTGKTVGGGLKDDGELPDEVSALQNQGAKKEGKAKRAWLKESEVPLWLLKLYEEGCRTQARKGARQLISKEDLEALVQGTEIEVYWADDNSWYHGEIVELHPDAGVKVLYSNGDVEALSQADFRGLVDAGGIACKSINKLKRKKAASESKPLRTGPAAEPKLKAPELAPGELPPEAKALPADYELLSMIELQLLLTRTTDAPLSRKKMAKWKTAVKIPRDELLAA